jgi:hypothetical protein
MICGYPSEPIVAEAAAYVTHSYPNLSFSKQLKILAVELRNGSVEAGYHGELIAKCLLMYAKDCTVQPANTLQQTFYTTVCTVRQYLNVLCGDGKLGEIENAIGDRFGDYKALVDEGLLSFTHFIYTTYTPSRKDLEKFFSRGAAVFCKLNQHGADLILPVYLPTTGLHSYILISVKNYSKKSNEAKLAPYKSSAEVAGIDEPKEIDYPYLLFFMDVGPDLNAAVWSPTARQISPKKKPNFRYPMTIAFQGLSEKVYPFLSQGEGADICVILREIASRMVDPIDFVSAQYAPHFRRMACLTY